jgi:pimeloyl-ACP methyl ester carboxylesterase
LRWQTTLQYSKHLNLRLNIWQHMRLFFRFGQYLTSPWMWSPDLVPHTSMPLALKMPPPLVLLPGFGSNSTMWFPNVGDFSKTYRVYAVDTIGQPGKSIPSRTLSASNSNDWITEVLNELGIKNTLVAGISLGGWLSMNYAFHNPERVNRAVLIDPAATFARVSTTFFWHSLIPVMIHPTRLGLTRYFRWLTRGNVVNKDFGEMMILGILNTRPQQPVRATFFRDDKLRQVRVPVLLLIGERSVIYAPKSVLRRATQLVPDIKAEIIPEASHGLNMEQAELVNRHIVQFLGQGRNE